MRSLGCDINALEEQKIFCPVVEMFLKYLKPLHSCEEIVVQVSVKEFSKVRFSLNYQVLREGICVARGETSHCFVNGAFKPLAIPKNLAFRLAE